MCPLKVPCVEWEDIIYLDFFYYTSSASPTFKIGLIEYKRYTATYIHL